MGDADAIHKMRKKKVNQLRAGSITILLGPVFAIISYFGTKLAGIDLNRTVASSSDAEVWGLIVVLLAAGTVSILISIGVVDGLAMIYRKVTGRDKHDRDYF